MGPAGQGQGGPAAPPQSTPAEDEPPPKPSTPKEARERLGTMGARVVMPPPRGAARRADTSWEALAGAEETRMQVEEALLLPNTMKLTPIGLAVVHQQDGLVDRLERVFAHVVKLHQRAAGHLHGVAVAEPIELGQALAGS